MSTDRTAPAMTAIVKEVLWKYGDFLKSKLIMQTYDGATVMSGHIAGVQALVREEYPFAFFFCCAAHRLNLVLCQSASSISSVKVFFANVSAFSTFTSLSSKGKKFSGLLILKFLAQVRQDGIIALVLLLLLQANMRF